MVRAMVMGAKTRTRRLKCLGEPGDRLWVREQWGWEGETKWSDIAPDGMFWYASDCLVDGMGPSKWQPSIHMPYRAKRYEIELEDVWEEPCNQITEYEAVEEGMLTLFGLPGFKWATEEMSARTIFQRYIKSLNPKHDVWNSNVFAHKIKWLL